MHSGSSTTWARTESIAVPTLVVKVKPNARACTLEQQADGSWRAQLKSPPVDGRANEELIALVARHFACRRSAVTIAGGAGARVKRVKIDASQ